MKIFIFGYVALLAPVLGARHQLPGDPDTLLCRCEADNENFYRENHRRLDYMDYSSAKVGDNGLLIIGGVTVVPRSIPICTQYSLSLLAREGKDSML